jgi:hypothetical protein
MLFKVPSIKEEEEEENNEEGIADTVIVAERK